jgi:hypothetical protein
MNQADLSIAKAILGIDTLWGGDVMCPSGTGRFIADSWFSDEPLPVTYTHPTAARLRAAGGVTSKDPVAVEEYFHEMSVEILRSMDAINVEARRVGGLRGAFLENLNICLTIMWELAIETAGKGNCVPYEKSVKASPGMRPSPRSPNPNANGSPNCSAATDIESRAESLLPSMLGVAIASCPWPPFAPSALP